MKKIFVIGAAIGAVVIALGAAGLVYAQTQTPPSPNSPYGGFGPGFGGGMHGPGMMGGGFRGQAAADSYGPLHEYMINAFAEALGLDAGDLEERLAAGETLFEVAEAEGYTAEQFRELMIEARATALSQAVADGVVTQEQADWMQSRMNQMWANSYGPGSGHCDGTGPGGFGMRGGGFRWNGQ